MPYPATRGIVTNNKCEVAISSYSFVLDDLYDCTSTHSIFPPSNLRVMAFEIFHTSIASPTPFDISTIKLVSLSAKYKRMIQLNPALTIIERRLRPSMDFLFLKKLISFLNANISNTVCRSDTIAVTTKRYGLVSRSMLRSMSFP